MDLVIFLNEINYNKAYAIFISLKKLTDTMTNSSYPLISLIPTHKI